MLHKKLAKPTCIDCGDKLKTSKALRCRSCARKNRPPLAFIQRFFTKVNIPRDPDECWEWQGAIDPVTKYGRIGLGKRSDGVSNAHRESYLIHYEFIGSGMIICHKCNNPKCVNPRHLYEGTYSDNLKQAYDDGLRRSRLKITKASLKTKGEQ